MLNLEKCDRPVSLVIGYSEACLKVCLDVPIQFLTHISFLRRRIRITFPNFHVFFGNVLYSYKFTLHTSYYMCTSNNVKSVLYRTKHGTLPVSSPNASSLVPQVFCSTIFLIAISNNLGSIRCKLPFLRNRKITFKYSKQWRA